MAFVVLLSTVSFTIEKHYCGDVLIDISVFKNAANCGMESAETLQEKSCCKDEINVIEGQDELKASSFVDIDFKVSQLLFALTSTTINLSDFDLKHNNSFKEYPPPNLVYDILLMKQVLLI